MQITSIDNAYEDDGLANLYSALANINRQFKDAPSDPTRPVLVAILPEIGDDGRLTRLNVCTVPNEDPGEIIQEDLALMCAADAVVKDLQAAREKAYAKLDTKPIEVAPSPAKETP